MKTYLYRASNLNSTITFLHGLSFWRLSMKTYLYRASNLNSTITFLHGLSFWRLSMKTYLYRASNLNSTVTFLHGLSFMVEVSFWQLLKTIVSCDLFIIIIIILIIIINFFRRVFSECTEAITTSLLETILLEECSFFIGFSCTVWTKMRSLAP